MKIVIVGGGSAGLNLANELAVQREASSISHSFRRNSPGHFLESVHKRSYPKAYRLVRTSNELRRVEV